jgi:hypothetical protein
LTKAMVDMERCQVGSGTDRPCQHPAIVKIQGIHFCQSCAREQEAYFTIGQLTEDSSGRPRDNRSLVRMLERIGVIRQRHVAGDQDSYAA